LTCEFPLADSPLSPIRISGLTRRALQPGAALPAVLPAYLQVINALTPVMRRPRGIIVTIDGRDGVGKTTLGRYLAWHFNVTLIETDLFLIPARDYLIGRGLSEETLREFRVGYAPSAWDRILRASRSSGFSDEELLADVIARLIGDVRHVAVGNASPIPATAALLLIEPAADWRMLTVIAIGG
jgi:hypothetical protein